MSVASKQIALLELQINNNLIQEVNTMHKQTVEFAITRKNGNITKIGRTSINQPKANFKGGSIKWYEDKLKKANK